MKKVLSAIALLAAFGSMTSQVALGDELLNSLSVIPSNNCRSGIAAKSFAWNYYYCAVNNTGVELPPGEYGGACIVFQGRGNGDGVVYVNAVAYGRSAIVSCN